MRLKRNHGPALAGYPTILYLNDQSVFILVQSHRHQAPTVTGDTATNGPWRNAIDFHWRSATDLIPLPLLLDPFSHDSCVTQRL